MKKIFLVVFLVSAFVGLSRAAEPVAVVESVKADVDQGLGLTLEQKNRIKAIREEYKTRQYEVKKSLNARLEALRQELDGDKPLRARVDPIVAEIKTLQGQLMDNRIDVVFKLREIYTSQQIIKLKQRVKSAAEQGGKAATSRKQGKKARKLQMKKAVVNKK